MEQEKLVEEEPQTEELEESEVETDESEESAPEGDPQLEEEPKEEEEFYTPKDEKPQRTEKEKAEFTLKSVAERLKDLGGDPTEIIGEKTSESQYVTKKEFTEAEVRKLARSENEVKAIMAWIDKGLSVEDAHLIANKGRVKATFSEMERANVRTKEATGAGQKKPAPKAPKPNDVQLMQWRKANMVYDPAQGMAKGKFTEEYWDGEKWSSRRIK